MIRIPASRGEGTRIELRCPDPSTNPYLTLAVCLAAGLDGIKNQIMPPASVDKNIFAMTKEERIAEQIDSLPSTLMEAIEEMEADSFISQVIGEHISECYISAKKLEWEAYRAQVTEWEIEEYLYKI